jgi:hypothetical protein
MSVSQASSPLKVMSSYMTPVFTNHICTVSPVDAHCADLASPVANNGHHAWTNFVDVEKLVDLDVRDIEGHGP